MYEFQLRRAWHLRRARDHGKGPGDDESQEVALLGLLDGHHQLLRDLRSETRPGQKGGHVHGSGARHFVGRKGQTNRPNSVHRELPSLYLKLSNLL